MKSIHQALTISLLNLRSLSHRKGASAVLIVGIAGVVLVLVSLLSIAQGLGATLQTSGRADRVLMLRNGSSSELNGTITLEQLRVIADKPGIARDAASLPIAAGEIYTSMFHSRNGGQRPANLPIRGVSAASFAARPEVRIVSGRNIQLGQFEIIVGRRAAVEFDGLQVGKSVAVRGVTWLIVGEFTADEGVHESEAWADVDLIAQAFKRGPYRSSVTAMLTSAADFNTLRDAISQDPQLSVDVWRESEYYSRQAVNSTAGIRLVGIVIGVIMGLGAIFAAINTMYSAVSARTAEIATLKALGFHSFPIVSSVLTESIVLATVGGFVGALVARIVFDGYSASTVGQTFSQVAFRFAVTGELMLAGVSVALLLGFFGGVLPAIRAARLPVIAGLAHIR